MSIYDTLNKEQKEACFHTEGPVLILAGAGSGKTRVITHRIAYLLEECAVSPWNILAITFTNKAAGEMRERVDKLIGFGAESVWISTFHSMCVRILRRHIDRIGYDPRFTIYDTDDQKALIRRVFKRVGIDPKQYRERSVLAAISSAKNELQTAEEFAAQRRGSSFEIAAGKAFVEYERELRANSALDFDDLLVKTVRLLRECGDVRSSYQERFRYIMVDEYQDTNRAQFEIVRMLAEGTRNLCVVGDDDQSIYRFRGADIRNILDFEKVYRDAFVVRLEQNYRSTQNVLDAANAVIANNDGRKAKRLWTDRGAGAPVHFREFMTAPEEASFVAEDIRRRMREDRRLSCRDFAVLYRTNAQSRLLEDQLVLASVPYTIVGGHNFYDRREVRDILSYLRTISNGRDDISAERIINVPRRGIGQTTVARIEQIAREGEAGFFEVLEHAGAYPELGRAQKNLREFAGLILDLREYAGEHSVADLIREVVRRTGYESYLQDLDSETAKDRMENVEELVSKAAAWEEELFGTEEGDPTLAGFLEEVSLVADIDQVEGESDRVLLMTMHAAKGLEFPQVYLVGMEDGLFPGMAAISSGDEQAMEEERRLAYVGITRAKDELTLTMADTRMVNGQYVFCKPSRFVREIPQELLDAEAPGGGTGAASGGYGRGGRDGALTHRQAPGGGAGAAWSAGTSAGEGSSRITAGRSAGAVSGGLPQSAAGGGPQAGSARTARLKATYVKPHTRDEVKPGLRARAGLDALQKGAPAGGAPDYGPGDRVRHVKFGVGTVESVEPGPKDYKVKVNFDEAGPKLMYAAFAKLVKVE